MNSTDEQFDINIALLIAEECQRYLCKGGGAIWIQLPEYSQSVEATYALSGSMLSQYFSCAGIDDTIMAEVRTFVPYFNVNQSKLPTFEVPVFLLAHDAFRNVCDIIRKSSCSALATKVIGHFPPWADFVPCPRPLMQVLS